MKLLFASSCVLLLLIGCNSDPKSNPSISEGNSSISTLPHTDQLTNEELAELHAEGLLTSDHINEIKTFNK